MSGERETIYHDLVFTQHGDGYVLVPEPLARVAVGRPYWPAVIKGSMSLILGMCPATHVWTPFTGDKDHLMAEAGIAVRA
jgi:hypothetical protein